MASLKAILAHFLQQLEKRLARGTVLSRPNILEETAVLWLLNQSLSREVRAIALGPGLEARFPARRREERACGPVTGKAFHFHALEKEMATHSSVLAWRILGAGEPGGLLSMGSCRVGHN